MSPERRTLGITIGALAPKLSEQLRAQNLRLSAVQIRHFQRDIDAVVYLHIRGFIMGREYGNVVRRLLRRIGDTVLREEAEHGE